MEMPHGGNGIGSRSEHLSAEAEIMQTIAGAAAQIEQSYNTTDQPWFASYSNVLNPLVMKYSNDPQFGSKLKSLANDTNVFKEQFSERGDNTPPQKVKDKFIQRLEDLVLS